ncbi:hypothetical protein ACSBR2_011976 [Camellia fascicularis]
MMNQSIWKKNKQSIPEELPTQIIIEILSRLPIKILFHCLLVCKDWFFSISDPYFAKLHLSRSPISLLIKPIYRNHPESTQLRLIDLQCETQLKFSSKINFPIFKHQTVTSCNGLLCLSCISNPIYVCNPILGEYITLPISTYDGKQPHRTITAFGFSPMTNQYKVIQFFVYRVFDPINQAKAMIYTIGEGSWRDIVIVPYYLINRSVNSFVNGALHWLTFTQDSPDFIRCFDFGSEQFRVVPEPPECGLARKNFMGFVCVGVLRVSLSISDFSNPFHWDIWIMKDYGIKESWSKEFVIGNVTGKRGYGDYYETIMILKNGEILMFVNKGVLVLYSPKEGRVEKLNIDGININPAFYGTAHIPSFVSLKDVAKGESLKKLSR